MTAGSIDGRWTPLLACALLWAGCFDPQVPILAGNTDGASGSPTSTGSADPATSTTDDESEQSTSMESSTGNAPETGDDDTSTTAEPPGDVATGESCSTYDPQCPEGMKCNAYSDGAGGYALGCFPLAREAADAGEPCEVDGALGSGLDDCASGSTCWDIAPANQQGVCRPFCSGNVQNSICEDPQTACASVGGVVDLCLATCDPLLQDCTAGYGCKPVDDDFVCTLALPAGYGDACDSFDDCDPGLLCTTESGMPACDGMGCCTAFCDLDDPLDVACPDAKIGQECVPRFGPGQAPPGYESVGMCIVP
jgi:hypothetical protein